MQIKPCGIIFISVFSSLSMDAEAIINGVDTPELELPFFTQLYFKKFDGNGNLVGWENQCGGTLIKGEYVITAKHCIFDGFHTKAVEEVEVSYAGEPGKRFKVSDVFMPPSNYREISLYFPALPDYSHVNYKKGDIAILRVPGINMEREFSLADINNGAVYSPSIGKGLLGHIIGMGKTEDPLAPRVKNAQMLNMTVTDIHDCSEADGITKKGNQYIGYKANNYLEFCARANSKEERLSAAYKHDSGGPFLTQNGGLRQLAGIISHGLWKDYFNKGIDKKPALTLVNARSFKNWTASVVSDDKQKNSMIIDVTLISNDNDIVAIKNDTFYIYDPLSRERILKKINTGYGKIYHDWEGNLRMASNQYVSFTSDGDFIVNLYKNGIGLYNLNDKKWGRVYYYNSSDSIRGDVEIATADKGVHLFDYSGAIYSAKIINGRDLDSLNKVNLPLIDGLKKLNVFSDSTGYRYTALSDSGSLYVSELGGNEWYQLHFDGMSPSIDEISFGLDGAFIIRVGEEWYYNSGWVQKPTAMKSNEHPSIVLKKLIIVDEYGEELKINKLAVSTDGKKIFSIGQYNGNKVLAVSEFHFL
ncbi:trypsin-like serine protease [Aeromonas jandaei]|uniref:trypsin-like serine protease n=1 Tax=Aeromonas jandaei TaxID=650 RepID=UPI001C5B4A8D|nr:trypsin-like serine protease [Aeromonas jandaei]MBW3804456.1 trypsin-like serine protease [Aeromonas jandaei]